MGRKGYDRMSTVLGMPCRIVQPVGAPKPREECQPFTFEMHDPNNNGSYSTVTKSGRRTSKRYGAQDNVSLQVKFITSLEKLRKVEAKEAKQRAKVAA